jgi:protein phosphatase
MKSKFGTTAIGQGNAKVVYACFTDPGKKRKINEDNFLAVPDDAVFCVADGVGGLGAGDLASRLAVDRIAERLFRSGYTGRDVMVDNLINEANQEVCKQKKAISVVMASTIVLARFLADQLEIGHVGDSRAYLWRNKQLNQLTRDHSLVAELYRHGKIKREEMENHPKRNVITRAIGVEKKVEPDCITIPLQDRDTLLLCTDGLTSMLSDNAIDRILTNCQPDLSACGYELVKQANLSGGRDNITVILATYYARLDLATDKTAAGKSLQQHDSSSPVDRLKVHK